VCWKSSKSVEKRSQVKWKVQSEVNEASEVEWGKVKCSIGGGRVFMENVYRNSKWWEVKDWGESVSKLVIGGANNNKKLYTVLTYLGVFTFCTCCKIF